jgi:hypothetical protein
MTWQQEKYFGNSILTFFLLIFNIYFCTIDLSFITIFCAIITGGCFVYSLLMLIIKSLPDYNWWYDIKTHQHIPADEAKRILKARRK